MLQPANRLTLIDALRPPVGCALESAMTVTFTLDLRALLAAPAALALRGSSGGMAEADEVEPIELLHALRTHADRITVFSQAGEIALPPSRRVFALLDRTVIPVSAPRGGIVHPKVWVIRYEPVDAPPESRPAARRMRVLISSRNLTFDPSWDTVVRLDEAADGRGASLAPVGRLFDGLLGCAVGGVSDEHQRRVRSLTDALGTTSFALPAGVDDLRTHVLGLTEGSSPLPASAERSLIIAPFVSDHFFERVHPSPVGELVSRPESLDDLQAATLDKLTAYVFDDRSAPDLGTDDERTSPDDPGRPLVGLHAKIFAFEEEGRARLFLGSANATGAAFAGNVEILLEFIGPKAELGIDRLCDGNDDERSLRDLFLPYMRSDDPSPEEGPGTLDSARRAMAQLRFEGCVKESGDGWAVTYRSDEPVCAPDGTVIRCWPLASGGNRRSVPSGEPLEARFETSLESISGFLAFELTHDERTSTAFVVPVPLHGVPANHEQALMCHLVGNAERFLRYLWALLDEDQAQMSLLDSIEHGPKGRADGEAGPMGLPVLERLLSTMRRDPAKLAGLHPLVSDLADDDALPAGFAELWAAICDAAHLGAGTQ